jgi:hypothetical protein
LIEKQDTSRSNKDLGNAALSEITKIAILNLLIETHKKTKDPDRQMLLDQAIKNITTLLEYRTEARAYTA